MSVSPYVLAALATSTVPGLDPVGVMTPSTPSSDFDVAFIRDSAGRDWTVRAPRHRTGPEELERELAVLHALTSNIDHVLTIDVPAPVGIFDGALEQGSAVVYPFLPGSPIDLDSLSASSGLSVQLGEVLADIHNVSAATMKALGVPQQSAADYRKERISEVERAAITDRVPAALLTRWQDVLDDESKWDFESCFTHGDLAREHVLVDRGRVSAIADWADARITDPAEDLAWVCVAVPPPVFQQVFQAYSARRKSEVDAHCAERARLTGELALVRWLLHGVEENDQDIIDDAAAMLSELHDNITEDTSI